jgi:hypothetical protein
MSYPTGLFILFLIIPLGIFYYRDSPFKVNINDKKLFVFLELMAVVLMFLFLPYIFNFILSGYSSGLYFYSSFILSILISLTIHFVLCFLIIKRRNNYYPRFGPSGDGFDEWP